MTDETEIVDEILADLELDGTNDSSLDQGDDETQPSEDPVSTSERLGRLHEAGAITDKELEILQSHLGGDDGESTDGQSGATRTSASFGTPIATSEGTDMDFSIVGVFEDIDTTWLTLPEAADRLDERDAVSQARGGGGRTLVFWQINNHSDQEIKLKHRHLEHIGEDGIAYNFDGNPLRPERLGPGWRCDNWLDVTDNTRVKYVSRIEMPVTLAEIKIDGYCSDVHEISITDQMRFPKSELPTTEDI